MRDDWEGYAMHYRFGDTPYHIRVQRTPSPGGTAEVRTALDGIDVGDDGIVLVDDQREHFVTVTVPEAR